MRQSMLALIDKGITAIILGQHTCWKSFLRVALANQIQAHAPEKFQYCTNPRPQQRPALVEKLCNVHILDIKRGLINLASRI